MRKNYVLINGEGINLPDWLKTIMCILGWIIIKIGIGIGIIYIHFFTFIDLDILMHFATYLEGFLILTLIYDLLPALKLPFGILASIPMVSIFIGTAIHLQSTVETISCLVGVIFIISYNIFLYKRSKRG